VLETAAGTGVVTRALAAALPAATRIIATDLNQPMLDHAKGRLSGNRRIEWKQADALALPFPSATFDAVACQFGAMFFPDKVQGYKEAYRVLKPGGSFFLSVWDRIAENEFACVIGQAVAKLFPHNPPQFFARTPHGYFQEETIRNDLNSAGFAQIAIDVVDGISRASSSRDAAIAFCQGTPLRNEIEARDPSRLQEATNAAEQALEARFGRGAIEGRTRALVITARDSLLRLFACTSFRVR
jgi:SAM-dependent methyltransferase